jgi:broad specificity phosphatase PhoE
MPTGKFSIMSKIFLIRHGQASFGAENYDLLSDIGREQASALGEYFLTHQISFDAIIHGQMSRQTETAQIMAQAKQFSGDLILDKGADEFDSDRLLAYYLPILAETSEAFHQKINSEQKWFSNAKDFELIFRALIALWQQDKTCPFESWSVFRNRSLNLLNRIRKAHGANKKIALVTSGGLISATIQAILGFDDQTFMDMNLTINNASVTEIKIKDRPQIAAQNVLPENETIHARLHCFNNISPLVMKRQPHLITRK